MNLRFFILFLIAFLLSFNLHASHLMGGNLGYEYIGLQPNGKYRYKIKLVTYIDCGPSSEIPYAEYPLKVGVYSNDILNPNADKIVVDSLLLYIEDTTVYTPFLPPGCSVGANTCIIQARYSGYVDLDASINGYYLFYERCCRNDAIINLNLTPNGSNSFLAFIPSTYVINNTPDFLYPPIPFLCVNDTITVFNTAVDPDGDSLVYEFTTPFSGFGGTWDPMPNLPAPVMSWPVLNVDYTPGGFSSTEPFSYFGESSINFQNGLASYFSQQQGTFVVCILVKEFRNGTLISQTYRDLQLLFNNCPNNYAPHLVDNLQINYTIAQGDTLCLPISFMDQENDSVFIEAYGDLFDTSLVNPIPSFIITLIDSNKTSGDFCWIPPCSMDTGTYQFYMKSYDNGCPPKERYEFYKIRITPPDPVYITGSDSACIGADSVLYFMEPDDGYVYNWNITGGNIVQNYGDSVVVNWEIPDSAEIFVDVYTATGCYINSDSMTVTLIDVPTLLAMPEDTICSMDTLLLTATGSDPYYWYPESNIINPQEGDVEAIISQSGWFYVAGLPGELCPPSDSVYITTLDLPDVIATTSDSNICLGDTIQLFSSGAITYQWTPSGNVFFPDSANTGSIPTASEMYIVTGVDYNQCYYSDTVFVLVNPGPTINITGDMNVCLGDTAFLQASGGTIYHWSPDSYIYPDTGTAVIVLIQANSNINLTVTDSLGCKKDTMFTVVVNELPVPSYTYDTLTFDCAGSWIKFNNTSTNSDQYTWIFGNGTQSFEISPQTLYPFGNTYFITLTAYNSFGCSSTISDTLSTDSLQDLTNFIHVNVFTPNDDGTNDVLDFILPEEFIECSKVYIYDRWGMAMFESSSTDLKWDGKVSGKKVPEGVYFWIVEINGMLYNGLVHIFK